MKRLFIFLISMALTSCGGGHWSLIKEDSYILTYTWARPQIKLLHQKDNQANTLENPKLRIALWGEQSDLPAETFAKYCNYQNNTSLYKKLCNKHRDNSYTEERYEHSNPSVQAGTEYLYLYTAVSVDFEKIDITCSPAYDDAHPDGSSVADIVKVTFTTLKPFIDAGYKYTEESDAVGSNCSCYAHPNYYHYVKMMNEMTARDMILLGPTMNLEFVTPPATPNTYKLELTMTTDEGDIYTDREYVRL